MPKYILLLVSMILLLPAYAASGMKSLVINEFMASNSITIADDAGNYADWIEIYNYSTAAVNLSGCFLTDDLSNPTKWQISAEIIIPAGEFVLFWADKKNSGLHTNFKLNSEREAIGLSGVDSVLIDSISYQFQKNDISFGRSTVDSTKWGYFPNPTPGAINDLVFFAELTLDPTFSIVGGFYSGNQQITLSSPDSGTKIYYTLDGIIPNERSPLYSSPINISSTTVVRARAFAVGKVPGTIITHSYFIDEPINLPVISLVTDPANFFDDQIGIYVIGTNGIPGYCTSIPMNLIQDWERPVNVELFEINAEVGLNQQAGVKIFGGCSRHRYPQKSLAFYARGKYGKGSFNYQIFPDKQIEQFESFILRASADDQPFTMFRDALAQMSIKDVLDIDYQAYRPVAVYVNGAYWGLHNLREKINEHYAAGNYELDPAKIDVIKRNSYWDWCVIAGSNKHYNAMMDFIQANDMSLPQNYEYVKTQMDVNNYIDYQITQIYLAGDDWPGNNIKYWHSNTVQYNKWRWILYDLDWTFIDPTRNILKRATATDGPKWPNPPWSTLLFRKLLQNDAFKNEFIQRYAYYLNTFFQPARLHHLIDSLQNQIAPEIPGHIQKWGGQIVPEPERWIKPTFNSVAKWEQNVQIMHTFTDARPPNAIQNMLDFFGLQGMVDLDISVETPGTGEVEIFSRKITERFIGDFFADIPFKITAKPAPGFHFLHWKVAGLISEPTVFVEKGATWKYNDSGIDLGQDWINPTYDHSSWATGKAELGYGDGDETTVVGYGPDSNHKYPTTYFRRYFVLTDIAQIEGLKLELVRDDGAVIYLNGQEVVRSNMPAGNIFYTTFANDYVSDTAESNFLQFKINKNLLEIGPNLLAVEIHQANESSSDLSFNLVLTGLTSSSGGESTLLAEELSLDLTEDLKLTAYFEVDSLISTPAIVLNEINYNSATDFDVEDWVEIYNAEQTAIDLSGWLFKDSNDSNVLVIPAQTQIAADSFLVLCRDSSAFQVKFPEVKNYLGNFSFGLANSGELIRLFNQQNQLIDSVRYDDQPPWPVEADGFGPTLELKKPDFDNSLAENWIASNDHGTPGAINSLITQTTLVQTDLYPHKFSLKQNYPNPFNPKTRISYTIPKASQVTLEVYDIRGRSVAKLIDSHQTAGQHKVYFQAKKLASGIYLYRLQAGKQVVVRRMLLLK